MKKNKQNISALKVVAIIQARLGSSRLPGKVLAEIVGQPMLWHVVNRVRKASTLDQVVVAIPHTAADDILETFCTQDFIECFRGSENDVLDRYFQAAKEYGAEIIVRVTADSPLIDPKGIDKAVSFYLSEGYDYIYNNVDLQCFSFQSLEQAWREAARPHEREHVVPYLKNNKKFRVCTVENEFDLSSLEKIRWYVNEPNDLEYVRRLYDEFYPNISFTLQDVIKLVNEKPNLKILYDKLFDQR